MQASENQYSKIEKFLHIAFMKEQVQIWADGHKLMNAIYS